MSAQLRRLRAFHLVAALAAGLSLSACDEGLDVETPSSLAIVSGNSQTVQVSTQAAPLSVKVTDLDGDPVSDVVIEWSVVEGEGGLGGLLATNPSGISQVFFTAAETPGTVRVRAAFGSLEPAMFTIVVTGEEGS